MSETTERDRLVATVALLKGSPLGVNDAGEAFVAAMEAEPEKPVQCPCCAKLVTLCTKHYLLHEPGKKCVVCWDEE